MPYFSSVVVSMPWNEPPRCVWIEPAVNTLKLTPSSARRSPMHRPDRPVPMTMTSRSTVSVMSDSSMGSGAVMNDVVGAASAASSARAVGRLARAAVATAAAAAEPATI